MLDKRWLEGFRTVLGTPRTAPPVVGAMPDRTLGLTHFYRRKPLDDEVLSYEW